MVNQLLDGELAVEPAKDGDTFLVASAANYKWIVDESNKAVGSH